jgi:hypothetical protein
MIRRQDQLVRKCQFLLSAGLGEEVGCAGLYP